MICKIFRIPIKYGGHSYTCQSTSYPEVIQFFVPDAGTDPHDVVLRVLEPEEEDDHEDRQCRETPGINCRENISNSFIIFATE